jgi:hypothetical protein
MQRDLTNGDLTTNKHSALGDLEEWERQSELARCLMTLLKLGHDDPVTLANSGIALLHKIHKGHKTHTNRRSALSEVYLNAP